MKKLKFILRILIITHIFPVIGVCIRINDTWQENYLEGWLINLVVIGTLGIIFGIVWIFSNDKYDNDYYL